MLINKNAQAATLERLKLVTGVERTGCVKGIRFGRNRQPGGQRDVKSNC